MRISIAIQNTQQALLQSIANKVQQNYKMIMWRGLVLLPLPALLPALLG